jgi:type VI secretion system protein ImpL
VLSPFPIRPKQMAVPSKSTLGAFLEAVNEGSQSFFEKLKSFGGSARVLQDDVLARNLQRLRNRFNSAVNFIKKNRINKNGLSMSLDVLPWYLMIGSAGSGKSSLVAKSNINFILGKKVNKLRKQPQPMIHSFDWWITQNAILVDVPGAYVDDKVNNASMNHEIWNAFLLMLKKSQKRKSLGGIVVTISVDELIDRKQRDELLESLVNRIHEIQHLFGADVPFYFSITKMDLLPGFLDFFNDCAAEELTQAWGVTMPSPSTEFVTSTFIKRFNALIRILNNQIIQRLHFERDQYARSHIKDFPLYVEKIKDEFAAMLNAFKSNQTSFNLKGVYLTSALQGCKIHREISYPETMSAARGSEKLLEIMSAPNVKQAPYFIKQVLLHGIMQ